MPRRGLLCFVTVRLLRERGLDSARCRLLATSSHLPIIRRVLLSSCTFQASPWPPENHDCIVISLLHHLPAVQDARYESIEPRKSGNAPELLYSGRVQRLLGVPAPSKEWMIEDVFIEERREEVGEKMKNLCARLRGPRGASMDPCKWIIERRRIDRFEGLQLFCEMMDRSG